VLPYEEDHNNQRNAQHNGEEGGKDKIDSRSSTLLRHHLRQ
jgi:hypothetical protein